MSMFKKAKTIQIRNENARSQLSDKVKHCSICGGVGHTFTQCPSIDHDNIPKKNGRRYDDPEQLRSGSSTMKIITVHFPVQTIRIFDKLVDFQAFPNRSEAIRSMCRDYIRNDPTAIEATRIVLKEALSNSEDGVIL